MTALPIAVGHAHASRNVVVAGHRTSLRLEPEFWDALQDIAGRRGWSVNQLVTHIGGERTASGLASAIRVYIVNFYRVAARVRSVV